MDFSKSSNEAPDIKKDYLNALTQPSLIMKSPIISSNMGTLRRIKYNQINFSHTLSKLTEMLFSIKKSHRILIEGMTLLYISETSSYTHENIEFSIIMEEEENEPIKLCSFLCRTSDHAKLTLDLKFLMSYFTLQKTSSPLYITWEISGRGDAVKYGNILVSLQSSIVDVTQSIKQHHFDVPSGSLEINPGNYAIDVSVLKYYLPNGERKVILSSDMKMYSWLKHYLSGHKLTISHPELFNKISTAPSSLRDQILSVNESTFHSLPVSDEMKHNFTWRNTVKPSIPYHRVIKFVSESIITTTYFGQEVKESSVTGMKDI